MPNSQSMLRCCLIGTVLFLYGCGINISKPRIEQYRMESLQSKVESGNKEVETILRDTPTSLEKQTEVSGMSQKFVHPVHGTEIPIDTYRKFGSSVAGESSVVNTPSSPRINKKPSAKSKTSAPKSVVSPIQGTVACKVCGGGSVVTKYGTKNHTKTCRYVTRSKYPTRSRSSYSSGTVRVKGYYRKDGTYVKPHTRRKTRK